MRLSRIILLFSFGLLLSCNDYSAEVTPEVTELIETAGDGEDIPVIIRFNDGVDVTSAKALRIPGNGSSSASSQQTLRALKLNSSNAQKDVLERLREILNPEQLKSIRHLWIINAISVKVPASVIEELSINQDVKKISLDEVVTPGVLNEVSPATPEWNLTAIGANNLWDMGYTGQNVVIGTMDTGVDILHQDLASRWRGGSNSWFDPFGEHSTPADKYGHGTQTMGIAIGGSAGGTAIGVAPGAKWISVKIFDDTGAGTISAIHQGFQWMLDPDSDPATDDAPDVVNNSWNLQNSVDTCNTEFQTDIDVLRSAGIAVIFSAGNSGPAPSSSLSPANNAGSLSVGSVDESYNVVNSSSRGPSACDSGIYPLLTAPGFNIRTADLTFAGVIPDSYTTVTGTSFAVSHVTGAFALLKSAFADATVADIEAALIQSAVDVGGSGADNDTGWGLVNVAEAFLLLQSPAVDPVAVDDTYTVVAGGSLSIVAPGVLINDSGSTPLTAVLTGPVSNGFITLLMDGAISYTPAAGFTGSDSFTYLANDGASNSNVATVTINVIPANIAPVANVDSTTTIRLDPVVIDLLANDTDADSALDPASLIIVVPPVRGSVIDNGDGTVTYQARLSKTATDTFSYRISDVEGAVSNDGVVTIDIVRR